MKHLPNVSTKFLLVKLIHAVICTDSRSSNSGLERSSAGNLENAFNLMMIMRCRGGEQRTTFLSLQNVQPAFHAMLKAIYMYERDLEIKQRGRLRSSFPYIN